MGGEAANPKEQEEMRAQARDRQRAGSLAEPPQAVPTLQQLLEEANGLRTVAEATLDQTRATMTAILGPDSPERSMGPDDPPIPDGLVEQIRRVNALTADSITETARQIQRL